MSDDREEGGVSGAGLALGVGGAAAAAAGGDRWLANDTVKKAIKGEEGVDKSVLKKVKSFFKNDKEGKKFASQQENIKSFNGIEGPEKKLKIKEKFDAATFSSPEVDAAKAEITTLQSQKQALETQITAAKKAQPAPALGGQGSRVRPQNIAGMEAQLNTVNGKIGTAESGLEALHTKAAKVHKTIKVKTDTAHVEDVSVKKLKNGQHELSYRQNNLNKAGTAIGETTTHKIRVEGVTGIKEGNVKAGKIAETFEAFKPGIQKKEAELARSVSKGTAMHEIGQGLKFGGNMGRGKVAVAVLAATGVAYGVGSAMFPSHARRIDNERARGDLGREV